MVSVDGTVHTILMSIATRDRDHWQVLGGLYRSSAVPMARLNTCNKRVSYSLLNTCLHLGCLDQRTVSGTYFGKSFQSPKCFGFCN